MSISQASKNLVSVASNAGPSRSLERPREAASEHRENPPTPLRAITSASGFVFPAIWSFPPFFTLQPNPSTLSHQLTLWTNLVLSWAAHERMFMLNCDSPEPGQVFHNKSIKRKLLPGSMRTLLSHMAQEGHAALDPPKQSPPTTYLIYWRKPDEWGQMIYDWVMDHGLATSIMTFYEITDGDMSETTDFREMPVPLLRKSLETLVKKGRAQIIRGEGDSGDGARFF
ncbi:ESCRT-II complex subunit-domain-containing protein [Kockovaella imperatae]|uniref:ESCRT-II complex subunit VPS25 n=1 Tax=Kockovaella imperatae TaxID=4999 RepID=A0A1Y1U928_9TREE|nr:ESCRT-II complex subunit-domain-containing protein [Kockovaella imperatae]ORX34044.1 ESCRT-II complex subunit-domain-containing protein [Kockovaella imperatae]